MDTKKRKTLMIAGLAVAAIAALSALYLCTGHLDDHPLVVMTDLFLLLVICVITMSVLLKRSMAVTLYDYANIELIGGILFASVLALWLLGYFLLRQAADGLTLRELYQNVVTFPRRFSFYALFGIVAISVLVGVSNVALIRHEGFCLSNALSLVVAGFYIGGTGLVYLISYLLRKYVFIPRGYVTDPAFLVLHTVIPLFFLLMLCYLECMLIGTGIMGYLAARKTPAHDKDYVIILGCSIDKRGGLLPLLKGRVNRAIRFAWEQEIETGKPVLYVPSGGQGANEIMSEGSAMELYLMTRGAEDYEIFPEKKSVNTWENMLFSKQVIDGLKPGAKVAFATTNYHILRSGILARRAGLDAEGIAGDTKWYFWPNGFVREFFGILAMNVRSHLWMAAITAAVCAVIGCIGYFGNVL